MMCATCYAINKKSVKLLNKKDDLRNHINQLFEENYVNLQAINFDIVTED